ncbi:MAG: hypothetical protein ACRD9R_13225 [Pyrinomonadaceae bacterium]
MDRLIVYVVACTLAALVPFVAGQFVPGGVDEAAAREGMAASPGWPARMEGRDLTELPLTERERRFSEDFPGRVARFTDGRREIVIRWVTTPTRRLHPAADCFAGIGYGVEPLPLFVAEGGARWGCFRATRGAERLRVCERIHDEAGRNWPDASAWYWAALGGTTTGPWWAVTVAEVDLEP